MKRWAGSVTAVLVIVCVGGCGPAGQSGKAGSVAAAGRDSGTLATVSDSIHRLTLPVMGTMFTATAWTTNEQAARAALAAARTAVDRVDTLMSVYKPASDLSLVNRRAGTGRPTRVSSETAQVLRSSLEWARLSDGAFDPTVGPLVKLWGFYRTGDSIPGAQARDSARALVGWKTVRYDSAARTVYLPRAGQRLDFGAIAKGYALDIAAEGMRRAGVARGLVDLGGNVLVYGSPPDGPVWRVGIRDPRNPEAIAAVVSMGSGAVATSGDYERFFIKNGVRYAHILNPRTGWPKQGVAATTAIARTGMQSDALSTTLFVLGPVKGCRLLDRVHAQGLWFLDAPAGKHRARWLPGDVVISDGLSGRFHLTPPKGTPADELPAVQTCSGKQVPAA